MCSRHGVRSDDDPIESEADITVKGQFAQAVGKGFNEQDMVFFTKPLRRIPLVRG